MNPNVIADSKHRAARQYAAAPAPLTGFGALEDRPTLVDRGAQHLKDSLLLAWITSPTLRVDGSNDTVAATLVDHLGDPAMQATAVELARLIADAANGVDVRLRAKLLMSVVMEHHARFYGVDA